MIEGLRLPTKRTVARGIAGVAAVGALIAGASTTESHQYRARYDTTPGKPGGDYPVSREVVTIFGAEPQCPPNDIPNPGIRKFESTITANIIEGTCVFERPSS